MSDFLRVAEVSKLTGLSMKALRVYEQHGLVKPMRTASGWRTYDATSIAQLHKIKVLKLMGLRLADIRCVMDEGVDLGKLLDAQEAVLAAQQQSINSALAAVRHAQQQMLNGKRLSTDDLVNLLKETHAMSTQPWSDAEQQLADKYYSASQLARIIRHKQAPEFLDEISDTWDQLIRDIDEAKGLPPDGSEAQHLAQRWLDASLKFHEGDEALTQATENWYREGYANPETVSGMPFPKHVWDFIEPAIVQLRSTLAK